MNRNHHRLRNVGLWVVQGVLAALFLFAGGMKLITPVEVLSAMSPFPGEFIRFIGICEVLGAFGLILPWALRIHRELTPLAAAVTYGRREALTVLRPAAPQLQPAAA